MQADDKKNIILATILTIIILMGWPYIASHFFPSASVPAPTAAVSPSAPGQTAGPLPVGAPAAAPAAPSASTIRDRNQVLRESPRIAVETPRLKGSINLKGARIDEMVLTAYRETIAKDSPPVRLFSPGGTTDAYFAGLGWLGTGIRLPDANTLWTADGARLTPTTPVTLRWDNGQGQRFSIHLSIDNDYMITASQTVETAAATPAQLRPYAYVSRRGHSKDASTWTNHTGPIGVFNGAANYDVGFKDLDESGPQSFPSTGGWIGFTDHHWLAAIVPDQKAAVTAEFRKGADSQYQADFSGAPLTLTPGKPATVTSRIFVGAKETRLLDRYQDGDGKAQGITNFDRAIDWGWFYWFEKPIFYLLDWLFKFIGNFGVAIICLTFIVRGIMFPIAQRQFASMAQMRAVQPKMKALQEKYKDDKPKLQQEMMELYKTEKINPLAGCLPIFLQIPVFFALYKVLMLSIEMRHQPFVLWIKDLSAPDPLHVLNLFGLLDFTPPAFLGIGVLAILLGITMWLQFKLNPTPMDDVQKQVFSIMPWMMMFMMAPFAAGLLIYWITSNLLTIAQQWFLYRQHPALKAAPAK
jgi:YidC/Oxa1 family membrane protein insertase